MFLDTLLSMTMGASLVMTYTVMLVMSLQPWWEAQVITLVWGVCGG